MANERQELPYTAWREVTHADPFGRVQRPVLSQAERLLQSSRAAEYAIRQRREHPGLKDAAELFGKDFLGPEVIENTFGAPVEAESIPAIPFTMDELERAEELDMFLVLRVDAAAGLPMTILEMTSMPENAIVAHRDKLPTYERVAWFVEEPFFVTETPRHGWALVGKELLKGTSDTRYINQTRSAADYLKHTFYNEAELPADYSDAVEDFKEKSVKIFELQQRWNTGNQVNKLYESLVLNQLTRRYACEVVYDMLLYRQQHPTDTPILKRSEDSTLSLIVGGEDFVSVGTNTNIITEDWTLLIKRKLFDERGEMFAGSVLSLQLPNGRDAK